ncbi:MAG: hypothetical protein UW85_C0003G0043 [Parcubacteria group bacterium GW2011_GWA1_Parcubacteria_45_10]|nr:MAG: hypothetical protein UW85_C0003G0043 [Parcubacteria group bacterium GW2011_GWA1_Parcubacteria_45_10]
MNAIWFFGFAPAQVDAIMPELVKTLDLGHEIYSCSVFPDGQGKSESAG